MKPTERSFKVFYFVLQCLARKIWRILLKSTRLTNILQVTSPGSGVQNGLKRMNLKNKSKWKQFEIYKIDFSYGRFSKTFNIVWKNLKKLNATAGHLKRMKMNEDFWKNLLIDFLDTVECGIWESQKGLRHWISHFVPVLLTTVIQYFIWAKKFHLLSFLLHLRLYSPIFFNFFQTILKFFENLP
jgi:hypothetical protein